MGPMSNVLDAEHRQPLLDRIALLTSKSQAAWGEMDVAQMLRHCQVPLEIAVGERSMKRGLLGLLFGGLFKRKVLAKEPFGRDLPTAPSFKVTDERELDKERTSLVALIKTFVDRGPAGLATKHPFFGPMTPDEWAMLQWKHLDHHLRQFGV